MTDPRYTPELFLEPVPTPNVGTDWTLTPNRASGWLVRSILAVLTTSAVVATRVPSLSATDGTREWWRSAPGATQAASLAQTYCGYAGSVSALSSAPVVAWQLPSDGLWLPQGYALRSVTTAIDVGDQWSAVIAQVMMFPIGAGVQAWPGVQLFNESSG